MRTVLLALALLAMPTIAAASATACEREASEAGLAVRSARADLMALPVEVMDTAVAPEARASIERLKSRLRTFVGAVVRCAPPQASPVALQSRLWAAGDAEIDLKSYVIPDNPPKDRHGGELSYRVELAPGRPDLLAVVAEFSIECGADAILVLYQRDGDGWREVMVRRSAPYSEVSGGWMMFQYAVSPPDPQGRWYVATSRVPGWCSSNWRAVHYDLSRVGATPDRPNVFFAGQEGFYLGAEEPPELKADTQHFELRNRDASVDLSNVHNRVHVHRFAIEGDRLRRIPPVALSARDFVDEWVSSSWREARRWTLTSDAARTAHAELTYKYPEFRSVRACAGQRRQVELGDAGQASWFLLVDERRDYALAGASRRPWPACDGAPEPIDLG